MKATKDLFFLGAGMKSGAAAALAATLRDRGIPVPRITAIEQFEVGAAWIGRYGPTDGSGELGTPFGKDAGYPYLVSRLRPLPVLKELLLQFSFNTFRAARTAQSAESLRDYTARLDRHVRDVVTHRDLGGYAKWLHEHGHIDVVHGKVAGLRANAGQWQIRVHDAAGRENVLHADGLVITGQGEPRMPKIHPAVRHLVFDAAAMWHNCTRITDILRNTRGPLGIAGGGETAAWTLVRAGKIPEAKGRIVSLTRKGRLFTRDENFDLNELFTNPDALGMPWFELPLDERRGFIQRGDRNVISPAACEVLNDMPFERWRCHISELVPGKDGGVAAVDADGRCYQFSAVVCAIGFDPWSWTQMLEIEDQRALFTKELQSKWELGIRHDLALGPEFAGPRVHLPMCAQVAQGPGFAGLSELGLFAERVLSSWVDSDLIELAA